MTIEDRIAERICDLEDERKRIDATITELRALLSAAEADEPREPEEDRPAPTERHAPGRNGTAPKAKAAAPEGKRPQASRETALKVAALLHERGPMTVLDAGRELDMSKSTVGAAFKLYPDLFRKEPPGGLRSPWGLTDQGRAAVA